MRRALLWGLAATCLLGSATPAAAERNWEFSIGGYGGRAFHADTTIRLAWAVTPAGFEPVDSRVNGLRFGPQPTCRMVAGIPMLGSEAGSNGLVFQRKVMRRPAIPHCSRGSLV